ncbi:small heat shock protein, chloroplastic-like [Ananas comosus]|uniref:Heat shock 22 kDa protein, mitochondrial n=1 Tax=Ananas comosus TaxID=4615 RepID=A0A199VM77_ANACO|nr:small heat shock protein, chloroplastic-like [Ananas comosus]OAY78287.1 Heat shock 22 kDa protein, mitochondrial [Ananas comosus]
MAAMIISRRAHPVSTFLHALRLSAAAASSSRSFAADAGQETSVDVGRRPAPAPQRRRSAASPAPRRARARAGDLLPTFFSDPWDPFNPGRALSQMLSLADQFLDVPFTRGGGGGGGLRRGWDAREDEKALYVKVEMPGLGKEDVKVWVEGNMLVIQGEEEEEEEEEDEGEREGGDGATGEAAAEGEGKGKRPRRRRRFGGRVELPAKGYKLEEIRAEMKNGLLRVVVPKAAADELAAVKEVPIH